MLRLRPALMLMIAAIISVVALFGFVQVLQASTATSFSLESVGGQVGLGSADLKQVVYNVLRWALGILTLAAVSYMIYGGYIWLTAAGDERRVEKAKQVILQAAIGLVIVLLAWAITLFVFRTFLGVINNDNTNTPTGGCTDITNCTTGGGTTFDISAVNTCSLPPDSWQNVPRSSAVSFTFNTDLQLTSPNTVQGAVGTGPNDLQIVKCTDANCSNTISPNPAPIDNQVYTVGASPTGTATAPKAEWVANANTLTFYHLSFGTGANSRYFEPGTTYRVTIPKGGNSKTLRDVRDRVLSYCRSSSGLNGVIAHCDDSGTDRILYTFTTSTTDTDGPALTLIGTAPSSAYLDDPTVSLDRNVPRSTILAITYSGGLDPASVTTDHFRVYAYTTTPDDVARGTCGGQACAATQIDPNDFNIRVNAAGTGAYLQFKDPKRWLESFTWYRVEVDNMRNLCGTTAPARTWSFQTNDVTPGVDFVYPQNEFSNACPSTEVFAQFKTSMWDISQGAATCTVRDASSFNTRILMEDQAGRLEGNFAFTDTPPPGTSDPNGYCKHLALNSAAAGNLQPNSDYSVGVTSDIVVNQNGSTLAYGDAVPGFTPPSGTPPWHFSVKPADQCYQQPYIDAVSPSQDANGACVSISGRYFEKVNVADTAPGQPDAGDTLTLVGTSNAVQGSADIKSWTNSSIVNKLDAGNVPTNATYHYQVGVRYPDPAGLLQSPLSVSSQFRLNAGSASTRPCLYSLSPSQGYPGETQFTAAGEHFGSAAGRVVVDDTPTTWPANGRWADTSVANISVDPSATTPRKTHVRIETSSGVRSNPLPFDVFQHTTTGPGATAPQVVDSSTCNISAGQTPSPNPYRGDTQACLNSTISVRFTLNIDPTSVNDTTTKLLACSGAICTTEITTTKTVAGSLVTLTPAADLSPSTTYQVQLTTGIQSAATPGVPMAAAYSWQFSTKAGTDPCIISDVTITPTGTQITHNPNYPAYIIAASPIDNACHTLNHQGLTFTWNSTNRETGRLMPAGTNSGAGETYTGPEDIVALQSPATSVGSTSVTASLQSHTSPTFTLQYDPTACVTSSDCTTNALGESCGASTCTAGRCTPVVNSLDPNNGPISTWTTIKGCWFGGYDPAKSKVTFSSNVDAVVPDPAQCGTNTWTNERIIREVPTGAVTGAVTVTRNDDATATSASGFTVNTNPLAPGLCKVTPTSGLVASTMIVDGRGFGTKGTNDTVTMTAIGTSTATPVTLYPNPGWADKEIYASVPTITTSAKEVKVVKGSQISNPGVFTVTDTTTASCASGVLCVFGNDAICNPSGGNANGCGYPGANGLGCCAPRPTVVAGSFQPAPNSTNICRNTTATVGFDQALDVSTVTGATVQYTNGGTAVNGGITVQTTAGQSDITYYPGPLSANSLQSLSLNPVSAVTVTNADFEAATANVPTGWTMSSPAPRQSTDLATGNSGHSVLADCSAGSCTQSYAAQNLTGTADQGITYEVHAWVKAEITGSSRGGFITRCSDGSSCGFDLFSGAPGLFTTSSGGWRDVRFRVTKTSNNTADLQLNCFANTGSRVWCDNVSVQRVMPTLIRGANGVLANVAGTPLQFTTGANICTLDTVRIDPVDDYFTANNETHPDATHPGYVARAWNLAADSEIAPVPNSYEWSWNWLTDKAAVASVSRTSAATVSPSLASVTAHANGTALITAEATITRDTITKTQNKKVTASSRAQVAFCVNPWSFSDAANNCDVTAGGCRDLNFDLHYCADNNGATLPLFTYTGATTTAAPNTTGSIEGINAADPTRLKSYFFKESATSRDTIGLLVFKNDSFLSPFDWFKQRFPLDTSGSSTTVAGYPAVKSGTTTYVGVTNLNGNTLEGLMFVFDYNSSNAAPATVNIADQLLKSLAFNTNVLNTAIKQQLVNDTKRRQDLTALKLALEAYKTKTGAYPALASGTYIPSLTTSAWPSWSTALGEAIQLTPANDPVNKFGSVCAAPAEAATCWAESTKTFTCPANSHIYAYRYRTDSISLYANMEYTGTGSFSSGTAVNACDGLSPSDCGCFNFTLTSP